MTNNIIVITGASGFIGTALVGYFSSLGWHVRALVKNPSRYANSTNVTYYSYNLIRQDDMGNIMSDANYLIHAAFLPSSATSDSFEVNIKAAKHIWSASDTPAMKHRIFLSSMNVTSKVLTDYLIQKKSIESVFIGKNASSLRLGLVIGNGGLVKNIVSFMKKYHVAPLINSGVQPIHIIDIDDLCKIIHITIEKKIFGNLNIGSVKSHSYIELYKSIAKVLKIKVILIPVPSILLIKFISLLNLLPIKNQFTSDNVNGLMALESHETSSDMNKFGIVLTGMDTSLTKIANKL